MQYRLMKADLEITEQKAKQTVQKILNVPNRRTSHSLGTAFVKVLEVSVGKESLCIISK